MSILSRNGFVGLDVSEEEGERSRKQKRRKGKSVYVVYLIVMLQAARFSVSAVQRIASLKLYRGRFSYVPDLTWKRGDSAAARRAPERDPGRPRPAEVLPGKAEVLPNAAEVFARGGPFAGLEAANLPPGPPTPLLDALARGDETGWRHLESDKLVMVTAANISHISADSKIAPFAQFSDGCWDVVIMNDVSKGSLLKMFLAMENGGGRLVLLPS